jgi:hypothetical protein
MPAEVAKSLEAYTGCVAGAASEEVLRGLLAVVGFEDLVIRVRAGSRAIMEQCILVLLSTSRPPPSKGASAEVRAAVAPPAARPKDASRDYRGGTRRMA